LLVETVVYDVAFIVPCTSKVIDEGNLQISPMSVCWEHEIDDCFAIDNNIDLLPRKCHSFPNWLFGQESKRLLVTHERI